VFPSAQSRAGWVSDRELAANFGQADNAYEPSDAGRVWVDAARRAGKADCLMCSHISSLARAGG